MTEFEANSDVREKSLDSIKNQLLWVFTNDGYLRALSGNGTVIKTYNLYTIFGTAINITSNVVLARADDKGPETLIFAFETQQLLLNAFSKSSNIAKSCLYKKTSSFVVAIRADVDMPSNDVILWMVPVPGNMRVRGQISGSSGAETQTMDKLIFYAEKVKSARIFSIN